MALLLPPSCCWQPAVPAQRSHISCCFPPSGLRLLYLANNPIGGSLPANWVLPSLKNMQASNCSLSGPLPAGWVMPSLQGIDWSNNALTGSIPEAFMRLPKLQLLGLQNNRLTGGAAGGAVGASWRAGHARTLDVLLATCLLALHQCRMLQPLRLPSCAAARCTAGPLPATMTFDTSLQLYGLGLSGNNFSGGWRPLPWM